MKLGRAFVTATAGLTMISGAALAGEVAPNNVAFKDHAVTASLTGQVGDPETGAGVIANRKMGNCLACHEISAMKDQLFQGNVGPSLDHVADRYTPEQLRAIVTDAKQVFGPQTVMPGFYSLHVGVDVRKDLIGKTILSAQQVEDVVAYLSTLK